MNWAKKAVESNPKLRRGRVWCTACGAHVDAQSCLLGGWPKHCGETMTLDSPEERRSMSQKDGTWLSQDDAHALVFWANSSTTAWGPAFDAALSVAQKLRDHVRGAETSSQKAEEA